MTLKDEMGECWQSPTQNTVSGLVLCCHDIKMSTKSADIWLLGQHVAKMLPTFPAKLSTMVTKMASSAVGRPP
jgi:hypothetical protein